MPRCTSCLEANKKGRQERQAANRKTGKWLSHNNKEGRRYIDKSTTKQLTCTTCNMVFEATNWKTSKHNTTYCETCNFKRKEEIRISKLNKIKENYKLNQKGLDKRRWENKLLARGLSIEWFNSQPQICGICGCSPKDGTRLSIDHDHRCCPGGKYCHKCVRGLLCQYCNTGLGMFKDNPEFLQSAINWLKR